MRHIGKFVFAALVALVFVGSSVSSALTPTEPAKEQPFLVEVLYERPSADLDAEFAALFEELNGSNGGCSVECPPGVSCCVAGCWWGCCAIACPEGHARCSCSWGSPACECDVQELLEEIAGAVSQG